MRYVAAEPRYKDNMPLSVGHNRPDPPFIKGNMPVNEEAVHGLGAKAHGNVIPLAEAADRQREVGFADGHGIDAGNAFSDPVEFMCRLI